MAFGIPATAWHNHIQSLFLIRNLRFMHCYGETILSSMLPKLSWRPAFCPIEVTISHRRLLLHYAFLHLTDQRNKRVLHPKWYLANHKWLPVIPANERGSNTCVQWFGSVTQSDQLWHHLASKLILIGTEIEKLPDRVRSNTTPMSANK